VHDEHNEDAAKPEIRVSAGRWQFAAAEEALWQRRKKLPNYRMANTSRRYLAAIVDQLGTSRALPGSWQPEQLSPQQKQQGALLQLGILAVQAASSALVLVAAGYEVEATAHIRRLVECSLRGRAVLADASGEHALQCLQGRPPGSLDHLAKRHGGGVDVAALSISAHADVRGVSMLRVPGSDQGGVEEVRLGPVRDPVRAGTVLLSAGYEAFALASGLAQAFEVSLAVPPFLVGELRKAGIPLES